jgi:hypothetical protein
MMMVPVDIPSKYFPLIMYALFSLFTGPELDYAIAIAVGLLYQKGYLNRLKLTSYYLESMEGASGSLHSVSRSRGWVLAGAALGHDAWIAVNSTTASAQQSSNTSTSISAPAGRGGFGNWAAQENGTAGTGADAAGDGAPKTSTPVSLCLLCPKIRFPASQDVLLLISPLLLVHICDSFFFFSSLEGQAVR